MSDLEPVEAEKMPTAQEWKNLGASAFRNFFAYFLMTIVPMISAAAFADLNALAGVAAAGALSGLASVGKVALNWFRTGYKAYGRGATDA